MKWKHKQMGWEAKTPYYDIELGRSVSFKYEAEGLRRTVSLPYDVVILDDNWEEIPDGRWLDEQFTVREFMEGFAMVVTEEAAGHADGLCNHVNDAENYINEQNYLKDEDTTH